MQLISKLLRSLIKGHGKLDPLLERPPPDDGARRDHDALVHEEHPNEACKRADREERAVGASAIDCRSDGIESMNVMMKAPPMKRPMKMSASDITIRWIGSTFSQLMESAANAIPAASRRRSKPIQRPKSRLDSLYVGGGGSANSG